MFLNVEVLSISWALPEKQQMIAKKHIPVFNDRVSTKQIRHYQTTGLFFHKKSITLLSMRVMLLLMPTAFI